jgi:hypothetical protein
VASGHDLHRAVIVDMVAMRVLKAPIDNVIDVIAMRDRFVAATGSMHVTGRDRGAVLGRAAIGIALADLYDVFVVLLSVRMLQMSLGQVIDVTIVANCGVATAGPMTVRLSVGGWMCHCGIP